MSVAPVGAEVVNIICKGSTVLFDSEFEPLFCGCVWLFGAVGDGR